MTSSDRLARALAPALPQIMAWRRTLTIRRLERTLAQSSALASLAGSIADQLPRTDSRRQRLARLAVTLSLYCAAVETGTLLRLRNELAHLLACHRVEPMERTDDD